MNRPENSKWRIEAQLFAVVLMWGLNFVVMKLILSVMHPHVMNVFRVLAAGSVLGVLFFLEQRRKGERFFEPLRRWPFEIIRIGIVGWAAYQIAFSIGLNNTTAGSAAIIVASVPLWTALLAYLMRLERLNLFVWVGLIISIFGTGIVVLSGEQEIALGSEFLFGNLIMILAASLWGSYTVLTKTLIDRVSPLGLTVLALLISVPVMLVVSIPYWDTVDWSQVNWVIWIALGFSGSLSTGIAIVFWNSAVKQLGASHTAVYNNVVPLIALIASFFFLGEKIMLGQILGGTFTIVGLVIMRRGRTRE